MLRYLLIRALWYLPTLMFVVLIAYGLGKLAPSDPVLRIMGDDSQTLDSRDRFDRVYRATARQLGLEKPAFYCALSVAAFPDTLYRLQPQQQRAFVRALIGQSGNAEASLGFYRSIRNLEEQIREVPGRRRSDALIALDRAVQELYGLRDTSAISRSLAFFPELESPSAGEVEAAREAVLATFSDYRERPQPGRLYLPRFYWHGLDNQFHAWFSGLLQGDWGRSLQDNRPVFDKIRDALRWTLLINSIALLLAFGIAIPLGVAAARRQGQWFDRLSSILLFGLFSLPAFWVGALLLIFFTTPEYGMQWFSIPNVRVADTEASFWMQVGQMTNALILPVFCLTYGVLALIARMMRGGMIQAFRQDYIRTAIAKGLPKRKVVWGHAFPNGLFPVITLLASVFPALIAGSVVIETIFNIPGMGRLLVQSIRQEDWPVVYAVIILSSLLTMVGILVADLLYAWLDPRVRYKSGRG